MTSAMKRNKYLVGDKMGAYDSEMKFIHHGGMALNDFYDSRTMI